ncbi:MAG: hypothetical protein WEG36_02245 [Gemmatimonadota bacterium]
MRRLGAALWLDVRVQARSRLYVIGLPVALMLGISVRLLIPAEISGRFLSAFCLVAIGGTTYMFGASMVLLEKSERTLEALRTSPLTAPYYLASKALTLSAFALVEAVIVVGIAGRGAVVAPVPFVVGVLVLGVAYTLIGIGQVASFESVTSFLFPGALVVTLVLQLPIFYAAGIGPTAAWYAIPTEAPLLLMMAAFEPPRGGQWLYALGVSVAGLGASYMFALARVRSCIGLAAR